MRCALRSLLVIAISLLALPLFAQTDVTGTWSGTYSAQWPGLNGCQPPISTTGTMTFVFTQSGSTVTGTATASKTPSGGTCTAPVFTSSTGNVSGSISGDALTLSAPNSATISASVSGNTMTGTLMNANTQIFFSVSKSGSTPSGSACNLSISVQCSGSDCSSTTRNEGTAACSGDYYVGFLSTLPPSQLTFSGFNSGLGLTDCFDTTLLPESEEAFVMCYGTTSLPAGGSFTTSTKVSGTAGSASTLPILGFTYVADSADESDLALVYAFANATQATCDTRITTLATADSGVSYKVSWDATSAGATAAYQLDEATDPNFTAITSSQTVNGLSATFKHTVTTTTIYYYRVRAALCNGAPGPYAIGSTKVIAPPPPPAAPQNQYNANAPLGSTDPVGVKVFVSGPSAKAGSLDTTTFSATSDKPYMTIVPNTGTIPPGGTTVTAVMNPTNLPPGANTGTVIVTTSVGPPQTNPVSVSLVTPVASGGKGLPPSNALIIPVVTHVTGAAGSYVSDVRLTNASSAAINYQITFTPRNSNGTQTGQITNVTVSPLQTIALNDITKNFFGYGATSDPSDVGFGALEIRPLNSSSTATYASSRTYLSLPSGTFGQFIAAIPYSQFVTALSAVPLPGAPPAPASAPAPMSFQQIAESSKFYTNLGLVEGSGTPASGQIKIYDDSGTLLKSVPYSLQPGEQQQLGHFLANNGVTNLEDGRIEITVDSPGGKASGAVSGYASVLDTRTSDPLAVMPVQASLVKATRYVLPGVSEFTSAFSNFHSDVRIFNGGATSANVTLTFYPQNNGTPVPLAPMAIAAGEVKAIDNVLPTLFKVPSGGGSIVATTPSASSLVLTGRTYSLTATGGTFGQFIPGVGPSNGSIGNGDRPLQILQLEESSQFRSNVGLVETTGQPVSVKLTLVQPDSTVSPNVVIDLAANEFRQLGSIIKTTFGSSSAVYNARVIVQVTGGSGRVAAYGSVIDNKTSDPTYVPAQ